MSLRSTPTDAADDPAVPCSQCGYDVRMQPVKGRCPECEASVARSRELAWIPLRPAWRDSDPRWRRRMVAGAWVLTAVPLLSLLRELEWDACIPVPTFFDVQGSLTLRDSYVREVFAYLTFTIGVALLFSRERFRRASPFDWTRRWGTVASWGVLLLGIPEFAFIAALVMLGIAALLLSMPLANQPAVTGLFLTISRGYVRFGPVPSRLSLCSLIACSSFVVLLACAPLFDALRSSGRRGWAIALLAPLALSATLQVAYGALNVLNPTLLPPNAWSLSSGFQGYSLFFEPDALAQGFDAKGWTSVHATFVVEAIKWLACLAIAVWLSVAQSMTWRRRADVVWCASEDAPETLRDSVSLDTDTRIDTIDAMDHAHPQLVELEQRIAWFIDNPEYELCVVVEPESQSIVRFHIPLRSKRSFREPHLGRIMEVELTPDEAVLGVDGMRKIGFEPHGHRKGTFDGTRNCIFPQFVKPAMRAKLAAADVVAVMQDVFGLGDAWLWTFKVDDPDQWPDPLPRPAVWPPIGN